MESCVSSGSVNLCKALVSGVILGYSDLPTNMDVAVTNGKDLCGDAV